jgi:hypothetical protein
LVYWKELEWGIDSDEKKGKWSEHNWDEPKEERREKRPVESWDEKKVGVMGNLSEWNWVEQKEKNSVDWKAFYLVFPRELLRVKWTVEQKEKKLVVWMEKPKVGWKETKWEL